MKAVVQHYKDMLPSLGLYVGDDNIIRMGGGEMGKLHDFMVEGREVYLPTDEALKDATFKEKVAFNPLAENVLKKRSHMLTAIQASLQTRLFTVGFLLISTLLNAAASQKNGTLKSTAPDLLKFMVGLEDVADETGKFFSALADKMNAKDSSRSLFNVYLKHGGQIKGEKYLRICSITSPLVKALEEAQVRGAAKSGAIDVWGIVPKRKMDVSVLLRVIKTVFPLIETEGYTTGSNDKQAPYCDALFQSVQILNKDIRYATTHLAYVEPCKSAVDYLLVNDDVFNDMDDYAMLKNGVIITSFNDGHGFVGEVVRNELSDQPLHHQPKSPEMSFSGKQGTAPQTTYVEQEPMVQSPKVVLNPVVRIPGTRQPLVDVPEEEYRTQPEDRRRGGFQRSYEPAVRGFSHPTQNAGANPYGGQPRVYDLELQLERALERAQDLEDELRSSRRRGYSHRDDYDDDYEDDRGYSSRRGSSRGRPIPRAVTETIRSRRDGRDRERDRFGRDDVRRGRR